jgi:hypothetical protein
MRQKNRMAFQQGVTASAETSEKRSISADDEAASGAESEAAGHPM